MSVHEQRAQDAGERRLAYCNAVLYADEAEEVDPLVEFDGEQSAGPFCGCDTCIVREVLDAAWPHMLALAREEIAEGVAT